MRCNVGINPKYLADQHLIAEYRELFIVPGMLKRDNFKIKHIPKQFSLGMGHINFFKNKLLYLANRHNEIIIEMNRRGFQTNMSFIKEDIYPNELWNDWKPDQNDSSLIRNRIIEKIEMKPWWYKYERKNIKQIEKFLNTILNSEIYKV